MLDKWFPLSILSLSEIRDTIQSRIVKKTTIVHDGWLPTESAVTELGYKHPPSVKHDKGYRDPKTGFHTNDAESENARVKGKNRVRYGKLQLNEQELAEYVFYVNLGKSMSKVLEGLALSNGGVVKNTPIV